MLGIVPMLRTSERTKCKTKQNTTLKKGKVGGIQILLKKYADAVVPKGRPSNYKIAMTSKTIVTYDVYMWNTKC